MPDVTFSARFNTIGSELYRYAIRAIEKTNVRLGVLVQALELAIRRIQKMVVSASYHKGADQFRQDYTKGTERLAQSFETGT
jgi:hypothetical protein